MALERSEFVQRLRKAREAAGLTQEDAARLIGVTLKSYNRWEAVNNGADPRGRRWDDIAKAFGVSREYLQGPAPGQEQSDLEQLTAKLEENNAMLRALLAHFGITAETLAEPPAGLADALHHGSKTNRRKTSRRIKAVSPSN